MKQEEADCSSQEQSPKKHCLFGCDPAPLIVLAIFILLFIQFFPEIRFWLLALMVIGILLRLAFNFFRSR